MMERKGRPFVFVLMPLMIGLAGLSRVMHSPGFALYRTVDVVQMLGSGACFGVTMVSLMLLRRGARA